MRYEEPDPDIVQKFLQNIGFSSLYQKHCNFYIPKMSRNFAGEPECCTFKDAVVILQLTFLQVAHYYWCKI